MTHVEDVELCVDASIGVVLSGAHGHDAIILLRRADIAMYVAKSQNVGTFVYDPAADGHSPAKVALLGDLRRALDRDELVLYFQPRVRISTVHRAGEHRAVREPGQGVVLRLVLQLALQGQAARDVVRGRDEPAHGLHQRQVLDRHVEGPQAEPAGNADLHGRPLAGNGREQGRGEPVPVPLVDGGDQIGGTGAGEERFGRRAEEVGPTRAVRGPGRGRRPGRGLTTGR